MKRIIFICFIAAMILGLSGCEDNKTVSGGCGQLAHVSTSYNETYDPDNDWDQIFQTFSPIPIGDDGTISVYATDMTFKGGKWSGCLNYSDKPSDGLIQEVTLNGKYDQETKKGNGEFSIIYTTNAEDGAGEDWERMEVYNVVTGVFEIEPAYDTFHSSKGRLFILFNGAHDSEWTYRFMDKDSNGNMFKTSNIENVNIDDWSMNFAYDYVEQ